MVQRSHGTLVQTNRQVTQHPAVGRYFPRKQFLDCYRARPQVVDRGMLHSAVPGQNRRGPKPGVLGVPLRPKVGRTNGQCLPYPFPFFPFSHPLKGTLPYPYPFLPLNPYSFRWRKPLAKTMEGAAGPESTYPASGQAFVKATAGQPVNLNDRSGGPYEERGSDLKRSDCEEGHL